MNNREKVMAMVKEIKETSDTNEVSKLLSAGNWIAIYANLSQKPIQFVMGKI